MLNFIRVLLAGLVLFSGGAFANTTYYRVDTFGAIGETPLSACMKVSNYLRYTPSQEPTGNVVGVCVTKQPNGMTGVSYNVRTYAINCEHGETYDIELDQCVPEPEQCSNLNRINLWSPTSKQGDFLLPTAPPSACVSGCEYNNVLDFGHTGCLITSDGYRCAVTYAPTGNSCDSGSGSGSGDLPDDVSPDDENGEVPETECRKFTNTDGSWGYDCNPPPEPDENNECPAGYMLSGTTCHRIPPDHPDYDESKDPYKDVGKGKDGEGEGTGDDNNDGLAKDSTLKDIDKTLKGIDSSIKSGDSTTHGLLRGVIDAINNKPVGGGGGGGKGGGSGGDGDEEGDQDSVSGGETCDNPPICLGDALQCEMIKQQFIARCEFEEAYDFESVSSDIESAVQGDEFSLYEAENAIEIPSFITGNVRWLSGRCPAPETINLRSAGGRTFMLSYDPLCEAADLISPLIVIMATVFATVYIGRGLGD